MTQPTAHLPLPDIAFRDGTPVSQSFDDVYFSRAGGIAETEHVFLRGNQLPARFAAHPHFTIAELGFGTGLNFLVAWRAFLASAPADHQLHYLSFEKFPFSPAMLREALALQPELAPLAEQLIAAYPLRLPGLHRIHLPRVTLTLGFGDAETLLPQLPETMHAPSIHAWFLDGFAPAKNPAMWSAPILSAIGALSAADATFATFTAAGAVRRGLAAQGFTVEKVKGYGHKREMLTGRRLPPLPQERSKSPRMISGEGNTADIPQAPLHHTAKPSPHAQGRIGREVLILGTGIAGATAARALAERGYGVTVLERGDIASGASGNDAAVLFPQLTRQWKTSADWYFAGYSYMLHQLARWRAAGLIFPHGACGMLRLPRHAAEEAQLRALNATLGLDPAIAHWIERDAACAHAGLPLPTGAAYFPRGSWFSPPALIRQLLQHPAITVRTHTIATRLTRDAAHWRIETAAQETFAASHCILATAADTLALAPDTGLKLHRVGGQVSHFAPADVATPLRTILCYKGYVIPTPERYLVGATYNHGDDTGTVTAENHASNRADVEQFLPGWLTGAPTDGRTSARATTPDRLPYIGPLDDGLWVSTGHGSRGMLSAPLGAEVIAAAIAGEAPPVTADLLHAVRPTRFA